MCAICKNPNCPACGWGLDEDELAGRDHVCTPESPAPGFKPAR